MADEVEAVDDKPRFVPLSNVEAIRVEMARVYREMRSGKLAMQDGTKLVYCLVQMAQVTHMSVTEARVEAIDRAIKERGLEYAHAH